jgi:hypothetical protein
MKKISMLWVVAILIINMSIPTFADTLQPMIGLTSVGGETQSVKAGEQTTYSLTVFNDSVRAANNVRVTITGDHPFKSDISNLSKMLSNLNPHEKEEVTFNLYVSPVAEQRFYEFNVEFEYLNAYGSVYTSSAKAYVNVENSNVEPIVGIVDYYAGNDVIEPGVKNGIVLYLKNAGTLAAKDVRVVLSGFSNTGIVLENEVDTKSIRMIEAGGTQMISYQIATGPNATSEMKTLKATIVYGDGYGNEYTEETELYFEVEGLDTTGLSLAISDVKYPTSLKENQTFDVTFNVENTGKLDIAQTEVSVEYPSGFVAKTPAKKVVTDFKAGTTQNYSVKLMATSDLNAQNVDGWIKVSYYAKGDSAENKQTISEYLGFFIETAEEGSKPKLIIDRYEYGDENVLAGEPYTLKLFIKNTSNSESTRNIKVTLSSEDSVFTPVDSSSSFFINSIRPGAVYEHDIVLKTKIDASVKIYAMTVKMEYEDGSGNAYDATETPYSETENLSIAVAQPVRLETADVVVPWEIYLGQPFYIEQEFYNMGKSTMYNTMVKLEGVESSEGSYFVGNFDAGSSDYFSAQAYANEEGSYEGKLVYSFEDALGNVSTQEFPFSYTVQAPMEMNFDENPMGEEFPVEGDMEQGNNMTKPVIVGLLILAAIVGGVIMRKRHKAKLQKALEELDD